MLSKRIISCLDVRDGKLAKSVKFVNTKDIGDPVVQAKKYYEECLDELVFYDITASSDKRDIMIDVVNQVTHLSSVDGAVVLNDKFDVMHIGAEIRISDTDIGKGLTDVMIIDKEGNKHPRQIEEKGTRHRSAYRFALKNPESLVMVISQDGPISVVKRVGDEVHVWEDVST